MHCFPGCPTFAFRLSPTGSGPCARRVWCPSSELVSGRPDGFNSGLQARGDVALSSDGRFVAFERLNLFPPELQNVVVHDRCFSNGVVPGCSPTTELASVGSDGALADLGSFTPSISGDGRFVAYLSF